MKGNFADALARLRFRAKFARVLLVIQSVLLLVLPVLLIANYFRSQAIRDIVVGGDYRPPIWLAAAPLATAVDIGLLLVVTLVAAVFTHLWIHRAHANLEMLGLQGLNYSPKWAVGSFFIPVSNLIVPFRAMRELCNRSFGESEYQAHEPVGEVSSWWTCTLVGGAIVVLLLLMVLVEATTFFRFTTPTIANLLLAGFGLLLLAGGSFFLFQIVGKVTSAQNSVTGAAAAFA